MRGVSWIKKATVIGNFLFAPRVKSSSQNIANRKHEPCFCSCCLKLAAASDCRESKQRTQAKTRELTAFIFIMQCRLLQGIVEDFVSQETPCIKTNQRLWHLIEEVLSLTRVTTKLTHLHSSCDWSPNYGPQRPQSVLIDSTFNICQRHTSLISDAIVSWPQLPMTTTEDRNLCDKVNPW